MAQARFKQSVTIRSGKESLKKYGLKPGERYTRREVAAALELRQRAKYGHIDSSDRSAESAREDRFVDGGEVLFELQNPEASAVGWYSTKFQKALDIMSSKFPELASDKQARDLMTALIAITSDGAKVRTTSRWPLGCTTATSAPVVRQR